MANFLKVLLRGALFALNSIFLNLIAAIAVCLSFFLVPTWVPNPDSRIYAFSVAVILLVIVQMNLNRINKRRTG